MKKLLDKILRRTERDVALAGAMIGSVSAMAKLFPAIERWHRLEVHFYGGEWAAWENVNWEHNFSPWRDFIKWYHGRPQSDCYVMYAKDSQRMFRRSDIRSYNATNGEREKRHT